jgi:hypothetical protein
MGFFDPKIINPTKKGVKRKIGEITEGNHPEETSMRTLTSLKWGRVTCLFR